jgi:hypothetical protein
MKTDGRMPVLSFALFAIFLAVVSGIAALLCRIGHTGILTVGLLTPYAALLLLADFDALPVWVAVLQFPLYAAILSVSYVRGAIGKTALAVFIAHCVAVVVVFARAF